VVLSLCVVIGDHLLILTFFQFPLKPFEDRDIDIAIDACGVCGSDVHTITGQLAMPNTRKGRKSFELTCIR
jgi:D-arabinose 1-dehydrogenase-like Zn-dependent alcohol dehydrogenase